MPTLDWIGKKAVVNHHNEVPFHLLKEAPDLSFGDPEPGNLIVEGDNLVALKALLPYYAGQVKCIYIDPPYNTGNENWIYNDNVNSPEIRRWLGKVVGGEMEDLSRHDKWLCMMYPRIALLREMLRKDGIIFVSLDDTEASSCKMLMDEVFGKTNCLAVVAWEKRYTRSNNAKMFYSLKDTLLVYRKSPEVDFLREPRTEKSDAIYKNPDNDPRGPWTSASYVNPATKDKRPNLVYAILNPFTGKEVRHPTHAWKFEREQHDIHVRSNFLWWGKNGTAKFPRLKVFPKKENGGLVPVDIWGFKETGTTDEGGSELKEIFGDVVFDNPKPTRLIERALLIATKPDDLVLDSFAGSGTTGHAILQLNKRDGGNRRCILVEMDPKISQSVTAERLRRVCKGYKNSDGETIEGLGGGFRYCKLGPSVFGADGRINPEVTFPELARHVFFTETGRPLPKQAKADTPLIGTHQDKAVYLLYNGILKDKRPTGGNVLTQAVLDDLPKHDGPKVVYGTACRFSAVRLKREEIVFKQIPYEIRIR